MTKRSAGKGGTAEASKNAMPWPTENPQAREEWDYRLPLLQDTEVLACHQYELARIRQTDAWRADTQKFRAASDGSSYADFQRHAEHCRAKFDQEEWPILFYALWPEWPNRPYLSVPEAERKSLMAAWNGKFEPEMLRMVPLTEILGKHEYNLARAWSGRGKFRLPPLNQEPPPLGATTFMYSQEVVAFSIPSGVTVAEFMAQAGQWYRQHQKERGDTPSETRGAAAPVKQLRADLCAIGFWRLCRSGMARDQAAEHTQEISGKPLIALDPSAWTRSTKRAEKLLRYRIGKAFDS